jgi:hypothetical protein
MPPKQPPTLKAISSDSDSSSEDNESRPEIKQNTKSITEIDNKKLTKKSLIIESDSESESGSESDGKTKKETKIKEKNAKSDNIKEKKAKSNKIEKEQILNKLSELQETITDIFKLLGVETEKNKEKKTKDPSKPAQTRKSEEPLYEIPEFIRKFIKCSDDAKFTRMGLSQEIRKQLIPNGKEQIITKSQLEELKINDKDREKLELDEVNKEELKEDIVKQLSNKKEKYYRVKFGKLLSIVSIIKKQ